MTSGFGMRSSPEPFSGHFVAVVASDNFSNPQSCFQDAPEGPQRRFWRPLRLPAQGGAFKKR